MNIQPPSSLVQGTALHLLTPKGDSTGLCNHIPSRAVAREMHGKNPPMGCEYTGGGPRTPVYSHSNEREGRETTGGKQFPETLTRAALSDPEGRAAKVSEFFKFH
jgi:hypothetical protein